MKIAANIVGALLGLAFLFFASIYFFADLSKMPQPPAGSLAALFMGSFAVSGWLTMVKILEIAGGVLVAIPKTRNFGLLVLGPIIINIIAYHVFIDSDKQLAVPLALGALSVFLLWCDRKKFVGLLN
jgi:putative oxidoreductase